MNLLLHLLTIHRNGTTHFYRNYFLADSDCPQKRENNFYKMGFPVTVYRTNGIFLNSSKL